MSGKELGEKWPWPNIGNISEFALHATKTTTTTTTKTTTTTTPATTTTTTACTDVEFCCVHQ